MRLLAHDPVMNVDDEVEGVARLEKRQGFRRSRDAGPCIGQHRSSSFLDGFPCLKGRHSRGHVDGHDVGTEEDAGVEMARQCRPREGAGCT